MRKEDQRNESKQKSLSVVWNFWEGWIDSRNHDWKYYKGINKSNWLKLAIEIAESLKKDQEIQNAIILEHFDFSLHRKSLLSEIMDYFKKLYNH